MAAVNKKEEVSAEYFLSQAEKAFEYTREKEKK
jgi:hypothetical protein